MQRKVIAAFNVDFGSSYGFGIDDYYKLRDLWIRGYVNKVICRDKIISTRPFDYDLVQKAMPLGNFFPRVLTALELYSGSRIRTTFYDQKLFDQFAARKLDRFEGGFLFSVPPYPHLVKKAKDLCYKVVLSTVYHPEWAWDAVTYEYSKYSIPVHPNFEKRIFERQIESLDNADFILVLSDYHKEIFVTKGFSAERILVNPLGTVHPSTIPRKTSNRNIIFLWMANVTLMKGLQYLLAAWSNLQPDDAQLLICGRILPETATLLKQYSDISSIKIVGPVSDPLPFYQKSSVFILPSLLEGMSRAVIEAMAAGLPVIGTPIAAPFVKNGHNGISVKPSDIKSLEDAIMFFVNNKEAIQIMGENARDTAKELTWDAHSERMANIFDRILHD